MYNAALLQDARDVVSHYLDVFGEDHSMLREVLEEEFAADLDLWINAHPEHVTMLGEVATASWIALGMVAWLQLRDSSRETLNLLGVAFNRKLQQHAARIVTTAQVSGDWWWACDELRRFLEDSITP